MTIEFKNKRERQTIGLFFGIVWIIMGLLKIFVPEKFEWTNTWFLILAIIFIYGLFYRKKKQYLTLENGVISKNSLFHKPLKVSEIKRIEKKAKKYILKTDLRKFTIDTKIIAEESLSKLNTELNKLNVEWN
ncbi:hypothetical protein P8625_04355 [Tenacibaculum tangerinum]|uniref:Uncharacterized protein n=1 Tax=Tenacibaculum tangerinum TaxID=3038772 RepID=A0ABY8L550_9FLAO|nr:hypothetical protein [Tenacibaculum tangerinum]WGH76399.1 hypothetical protein P8625_04355 [Tenacibaculum tangerinum]